MLGFSCAGLDRSRKLVVAELQLTVRDQLSTVMSAGNRGRIS